MGKVYIRTYAYNAEKTLSRTINSVLNQTYKDFEYYLCENGSQDGTKKIVEEYAAKDTRIKAFYNSYNYAPHETDECLYLPYRLKETDYYCILDADDEYAPEFLEEMLSFMERYELDIAVCGSNFLDVSQNNRLVGKRMLSEQLILENRSFAEHFPAYHSFMRVTWGKLYRGNTMHVTVQDSDVPDFPHAYGGDTYNTMQTFKSAKRVGILPKALHTYYISKKSVSYQYNPNRVEADQILHKATLEYLNNFGPISYKNEEFLLAVYMNAIKDTLQILYDAPVSIEQKLDDIYQIYESPYTKQLITKENFGKFFHQENNWGRLKTELFSSITEWLASCREISDEKVIRYCEMGELFSAAAEMENEWLFFKKLRLQFLLEQMEYSKADKELSELEELIPDDCQVQAFRNILGGNGYGKNNS